jgi:ketol-acid reductoisomerase
MNGRCASIAALSRVAMAARIYNDRDADLRSLHGKICAVIGFGSQGRAHALNLRDSGVKAIVGLYRGSKSRARAKKSGLQVLETKEAVRRSDILFLALPDTKIAEIYEREIAPHLRANQTLLFAHGFAILYRTIRPPKNVDVIMVAPLGLGQMVRREFEQGRGVPALIAVHQDFTKRARQTALAWAKGIGATRAGVIASTFREETETDLFSEQAVLCGGMSALVRAGFETLVNSGYAPEIAYFECLHELKFIVDLMHEAGLSGMRALISETALWGELTAGPKIIDRGVHKRMAAALRKIQTGQFARELLRETQSGRRKLRALLRDANSHPIEKIGAHLRKEMAWKIAPLEKHRS